MLNKEQLEFLQKVVGPALESERVHEIPACITIAQAILESSWGHSTLLQLANNPFGIKYSHQQGLEGYTELDAPTKEWADGQLQIVTGGFTHFTTLAQAFLEHSRLFMLHRYVPAWNVRHDWRQFAQQIMACGYSTDRPGLCGQPDCPHYAGKLVELVNEYRLDDPRALEWYAKGEDPGARIQDLGIRIQEADRGVPNPESLTPNPEVKA